MEIFNKRLKELISSNNLSQKKVAKSIGISQQAISRYLNEERTPDIETLKLLAIYFDVTADYLIGLENEDGTKNINISNSFNNNKGKIDFKA